MPAGAFRLPGALARPRAVPVPREPSKCCRSAQTTVSRRARRGRSTAVGSRSVAPAAPELCVYALPLSVAMRGFSAHLQLFSAIRPSSAGIHPAMPQARLVGRPATVDFAMSRVPGNPSTRPRGRARRDRRPRSSAAADRAARAPAVPASASSTALPGCPVAEPLRVRARPVPSPAVLSARAPQRVRAAAG